MGLLDSLLGGGHAPGGHAQSGMSPVVKALLVALALKAGHEYMNRRREPGAAQPAAHDNGGGLGGLLGGLLGGAGGTGSGPGGLGGLLSGGGLGGLIASLGGTGALGALVEQFNRNGHGDVMNSWIGRGDNQPIEPQMLAEAIGPEELRQLEQASGMPKQQLLTQLAQELPTAIDHLSPQGRLPTDAEI